MDDQTITSYLTLLDQGEMSLSGLLDWGSNYTFLVDLCIESDNEENGTTLRAVYKPQRGERPLWDFPRGSLYRRERTAFLVSELLEWRIVPPTIIRNGPYGKGSVQLFIAHNPDEHYLTFDGQFADQLQRFVLFDAVINNADRKSGHVLLDADDRLWSIDHGICFHSESKLRSVIWDFAGQLVPLDLLNNLSAFADKMSVADDPVSAEINAHLSQREVSAMIERARQLCVQRVFPIPGPGRHYPWPPV